MILSEYEANRMLAEAGLPMIPVRAVESAGSACHEAAELASPVALKLSSTKYTHKTEIGGVVLHLTDPSAIEAAFVKLARLRDQLDPQARIILEPMAPRGVELFIGYERHVQFGPVLSLGVGGIFLELIDDVTFRLLPAGPADFAEMLGELKSWPKLRGGFRDLPPLGEAQVLHLVQEVASFALSKPDLQELDLNPVIFRPEGPLVVDATVILAGEEG